MKKTIALIALIALVSLTAFATTSAQSDDFKVSTTVPGKFAAAITAGEYTDAKTAPSGIADQTVTLGTFSDGKATGEVTVYASFRSNKAGKVAEAVTITDFTDAKLTLTSDWSTYEQTTASGLTAYSKALKLTVTDTGAQEGDHQATVAIAFTPNF